MENKDEKLEVKREFNLGDKGFFFLTNSLETIEGEVVGFYYTFEFYKDGEKQKERPVLWYQMSYNKKIADKESKIFLATVPTSEIERSKEEIDKKFAPLRKQRIGDAIAKELKNKEGLEVDKKTIEECLVEVGRELNSLLETYRKDYGEYKPT